ncbi:MAG: ADP-ribosylglycohydrolase family protein [Paracoccaceae bacterium]|nr:ADP-ribosylglycohydrolase family protein [Paracoccaceae bacterium]MDE2673521.1 ADP-ribosylglycohydrolase family protein [Paracoccaceae bacterium]
MGQLAGDSLGSLVEFQSPETILRSYPDGVRELADGGTWNTIAGQPTDDSEMALMLARMLIENGTYDRKKALKAYQFWLKTGPFDCGATISSGLQGFPLMESQANGTLMRICPLGIFGINFPLETVSSWAMQDAELTHPNQLCLEINAIFTMAISHAIKSGCETHELYRQIKEWALDMGVDPQILDVINKAVEIPLTNAVYQQGWVLKAFHNALWQLTNAPNLEEGIVATVMLGGDTDTNAAICGALLGSVYGLEAIPVQWKESILVCRAGAGFPGVKHPRPECFWPVDAHEIAVSLVSMNDRELL